MNILITNDDGLNAEGIRVLAEEISKEHKVYVVAPDTERSATSQSLTLRNPIKVKEIKDTNTGAIKTWITSGTPADCVKLAVTTILKKDELPDVVISGINHGPNLGHDVRYSGTVSAALEASMLGYNAYAISIAALDAEYKDFIYPAKFMKNMLNDFRDFHPKTILNINIPKQKEEAIKGIEVTKLAGRVFTSEYKKINDSRGREYYWLAGVPAYDIQEDNTDIQAIRENKISITPICYDMTNYNTIQKTTALLNFQHI